LQKTGTLYPNQLKSAHSSARSSYLPVTPAFTAARAPDGCYSADMTVIASRFFRNAYAHVLRVDLKLMRGYNNELIEIIEDYGRICFYHRLINVLDTSALHCIQKESIVEKSFENYFESYTERTIRK
jgi:hypothetical protein